MRIFNTVWPIQRKGDRKIIERGQESYESERLDYLGIVAGVCQELGVTAYLDALAQAYGGESLWD